MKHIKSAFCFLFFLVPGLALGQRGEGQNLKLWYDQPADIWEEALPLGNGKTGAMVFGHVKTEHLQLNDNTLWSGYPRPGNNPDAPKYLPLLRKAIFDGDYGKANLYWKRMQGTYSARYLPLGDLFLDFDHQDTTRYYRDLDLNTAIASVSYTADGVRYHREVFISHPDHVLVLRITANKKKSISFSARLQSKLHFKTASDGTDGLLLNGKAPMYVAHRASDPLQVVYDDADGEGMNFQVRMKIKAEGGTVLSNDSILSVTKADMVTIYLTEATSFNGFDKSPGLEGKDPAIEARSNMESAIQKTFAQLRQTHIDDYQHLFKRVHFDLGADHEALKLPTDDRLIRFSEGKQDNQLQALYYQFGRYLLISSSRPGGPPANLQGIWNNKVQPPWGSNYTININTEMNYWPAEVTNLAECHEPLFDYINNLSVTGAETAKVNYGIDQGWCAHHNSDIWAKSSPAGGYQWDSNSHPRWACWPMAGAWLSEHLWQHFLFTGDKAFLKTEGWPRMKGAAQFMLAWLVEGPDGYLVTNPSTSPEHTFTIDGKQYELTMASTMDMAIIRELLGNCIQACDILGTDQDFKAQLQHAKDRLYPYHIGQYGQLQEWFKDWDDPNDKHRHISQLYGLYPGTQIQPGINHELAQAAKQTLIERGDVSTGCAHGLESELVGAAPRWQPCL